MVRPAKAAKPAGADKSGGSLLSRVPAAYRISEHQPFQEDFGVRVGTATPEAEGYRDFCVVREGLAILIGDVEHVAAHDDVNEGDDVIKFHFRYAGRSSIGQAGAAPQDVDPMSFGLLVQPAGLKKVEYFRGAEHEQSVTLLCQPAFLDDVISGTSLALPGPMKQFLCGNSRDMYSFMVRMRPEMIAAVRALFESGYTGRMRQLQIEAKALELICQTLDMLSDMWATQPGEGVPLRRRDLQRVAEICDILENHLADAPTIADLARAFCWNETQLMRTFRQAMGITVHGYLHRARMERAQELLVRGELSITQIALDVGYEYSSNFTTAFRRFFGLTPKQVRAGG